MNTINLKEIDKIIKKELSQKEDWEIIAYCGSESHKEYIELRRFELLYPNTEEGNNRAIDEAIEIASEHHIKSISLLIDYLDTTNIYLKKACLRRKNYRRLKLYFPYKKSTKSLF